MDTAMIKKPSKKATEKEKITAPKKLKLLVTIVERNKTEFYVDVLEDFEVNLQMIVYGKGTAEKKATQFLGFGDESKGIILSIVREDKISHIIDTLEEKFEKVKHGKGIAFSISLTSVIGVMIYQFLTNHQENFKKGNN